MHSVAESAILQAPIDDRPAWSLAKKLAFRFFFLYFVLYFLTGVELGMASPYLRLPAWYQDLWRHVVVWVARRITALLVPPTATIR